MKQMCKKKYPSPLSCRNKLSNPRCLTVSAEPRLQTTVRQLGLESSIRQNLGKYCNIWCQCYFVYFGPLCCPSL